MLDGSQQFGVFLAHDLVKLRGPHPGLLQLLEWLSGIDALMLARVPISSTRSCGPIFEEIPHLLRASEGDSSTM